MINVVANGRQQVVSITIDKEVVDPEDVEMLEDMVLTAVREAQVKAQEMAAKQLGGLTGGLKIPGLM